MPKKAKPFVPPYPIGSVVRVKKDEYESITKGTHVITDINIYAVGDYEYATNRSAWHRHAILEFVHGPTPESIAAVVKSKYEDEEEDE